MPFYLVLLLAFLVGLLVSLALMGKRSGTTSVNTAAPAYKPRQWLLSKAEAAFLQHLDDACGANYRIFAQVRVADLLMVRDRSDASEATRHFNKISRKHIDFVIVERDTTRIACCIELDDRSHRRQDRQDRDSFVNEAFSGAGLPLLRVPCRESYDTMQLRDLISKAISGAEESHDVTS